MTLPPKKIDWTGMGGHYPQKDGDEDLVAWEEQVLEALEEFRKHREMTTCELCGCHISDCVCS